MKAKVSIVKQEAEVVMTSKEARAFLKMVIPKAAQELGGIMHDGVRYWRFKNQIRILERANAFAKQHKVTLSPVNLKVLAPLLEHASLDDDESLQDRWAAMLLNAATDGAIVNVPHVKILSELSVVEVKILDWIYDRIDYYGYAPRSITGDFDSIPIKKEEIIKKFSLDYLEFDLLSDNLLRLSVWRKPMLFTEGGGIDDSKVSLTMLGYTFVAACRLPKSP